MHADALAHGARVLIHDDLLATGGTARALAELVERLGGDRRRLRVPRRARLPRRAPPARGLRRARAGHVRRMRVARSRVLRRAGRRRLARARRPVRDGALVAARAARRGRRRPRLDARARQARAGAACAPTSGWRSPSPSGCGAGRCSSRGSPFERVLSASVTEARLAPAGEGRELRLELRQSPRGWARLRRRSCCGARRGASSTRRSTGWRARSSREARAAASGAGASRARGRGCPTTRRRCCASGSASRARSSPRRSPRRTCGCASRSWAARCARRSSARSAPSTCATTARSGCCARPASPTSTCSPCARATARTRPTSSSRPAGHAQVEAVLRACAEAGAAVIPFGGGTSVVGGVAPERGPFETAVCLDLGRLDAVLDVDVRSRLARVGAGLRLPELDHALAAPRAAARARAAELRVGDGRRLRGDALGRPGVDGLRPLRRARRRACAARRRRASWRRSTAPASAAGPDLRALVLGSEGTLGAITELTLRVRPVADASGATRAGCCGRSTTAARRCAALAQAEAGAGRRAAVGRGRDAHDARVRRAGAGCARGVPASAAGRLPARDRLGGRRAGGRRAPARARPRGAALVRRAPARPPARARRGAPRASPARTCATRCSTAACSSRRSRRRRPGRGSAPSTRPCATRSPARSRRRRRSSAATSRTSIPTARRSTSPCSRRQDARDPAGQWRAAKRAASDAIAAAGATITHHHAVGRDHAPWLAAEHGALGLDVLRAVKERVRPARGHEPGQADTFNQVVYQPSR